ncbi:response regulator [Actinoallomurus sp. CA-150999]|uniref:response regulator n=1 Tax=Actinoallomurus sp. CA-150999 TaxID=3239887 RepID=UPI003D90EC49
MRVLIVDDDPGVRRLLRVILERDGHEADLAGGGNEAWHRLTTASLPRLLILDRMLPDIDGADLVTRIRAAAHTANLPVLVLTADAGMSGDLDDGSLTRVLAKPFDLDQLRELISALAGGRSARPD